ncbi:muscleblind-like protein 1 isoform X4 [Mytilus edulis]|uniref:muscleblind-like protein 1 isoform X4 n=1 Tax=Mytilus edulis TaxID=6550 RepID=UPI0039EDF679
MDQRLVFTGKCQRKDPPCKYLHPPQHLREQLLQNGRNNLILKNLQMQAAMQPIMYSPAGMAAGSKPLAPYHTILQGQTLPFLPPQYVGQPMAQPQSAMQFNPYSVGVCAIPTSMASDGNLISQQLQNVIPTPITTLASQQKLQRADRLEVCREFQRGTCTRQPNECRYAHPPENVTVDTTDNLVTVCMDHVKGKCTRESCKYFHPPSHLQAQIKAAQQRANTAAVQTQALPQVVEVIQGKKRPRDPTDDLVLQNSMPTMIPYKRVAIADGKSPVPAMYQQPMNIAAYQQAIAAMQGQQYFPLAYSKAGPMNGAQIYQPTFSTMQMQQAPVTMPLVVNPAEAGAALVTAPATLIPTNAQSVNYFDQNGQLLDSLPACRDFRLGQCQRPTCKYVHVLEEYVEVGDGKVTVCRDSVRGKCTRPMCKYYHIPVELPPAK